MASIPSSPNRTTPPAPFPSDEVNKSSPFSHVVEAGKPGQVREEQKFNQEREYTGQQPIQAPDPQTPEIEQKLPGSFPPTKEPEKAGHPSFSPSDDAPGRVQTSAIPSGEAPPTISTPKPGSGTKESLRTAHHASISPGIKAKKYSYPSSETPTTSAVGVGSLPGNISEASVAKLPEERRTEALTSEETHHEVLGKTAGIGPLPGGPTEGGVALSPEERRSTEDKQAGMVQPKTETSSSSATATSPLSQAITAAGLASATTAGLKPEAGLQTIPRTKQDIPKFDLTASNTYTSEGQSPLPEAKIPTTEIPCEKLSTAPETLMDTSETNPPAPRTSGAPLHEVPPGKTPTSTTGAGAENATPTKVGFMDKVRGEAMIITGKIGRNEKKIEEGRHLMGK